MIYILTDTDYESPSIQTALEGPEGFDWEMAQNLYVERKIKQPFVRWISRRWGFRSIRFDVEQIANFEQPKRQPPMSAEDKAVFQSMMRGHAEQMENQNKVLKLLQSGSKGKVRFNYDAR